MAPKAADVASEAWQGWMCKTCSNSKWTNAVRFWGQLQNHVEVNTADMCRFNFYFHMSSNNLWICFWNKLLYQGTNRGRCSYSSQCFVSWPSDSPYLYQMLWWRNRHFAVNLKNPGFRDPWNPCKLRSLTPSREGSSTIFRLLSRG